jgi:hypothetical protein
MSITLALAAPVTLVASHEARSSAPPADERDRWSREHRRMERGSESDASSRSSAGANAMATR